MGGGIVRGMNFGHAQSLGDEVDVVAEGMGIWQRYFGGPCSPEGGACLGMAAQGLEPAIASQDDTASPQSAASAAGAAPDPSNPQPD